MGIVSPISMTVVLAGQDLTERSGHHVGNERHSRAVGEGRKERIRRQAGLKERGAITFSLLALGVRACETGTT
jgi:hypothetical protein